MSFDWNTYDLGAIYEPVEEPKKVKKNKEQSTDFDWDTYGGEKQGQANEPEEESALKDYVYQQLKPEEKTPEELKNMSLEERYQFAQDLKNSREYLQGKGFVKSAISGLTLGASENVEALKPQPHELHQGFGELVGSAAPIGVAAKVVGAPVNFLFKNAPKIIQGLAHAFGTGATYEAGKQGVNAASGNEVDLLQIPKTGAEFATINSILKAGGKLVEKFKNISPKNQASILENGVIPENLPKSQYEVAEEMLSEIRKKSNDINFPPDDGGSGGGGASTPPPALSNRKLSQSKDIGLRPHTKPEKPSLQEEVGDLFSKEKFYNTTEGGKFLKKEIMNIDEEVYRGVNDLYKTSKELNSAIEDIHPNLARQLESKIEELSKIPEPSDVQKRLLKAQKKILNELAAFEDIVDEEGNKIGREISGYKPINNQTIIDQIQSLRQIIDYDFSHGNTKNIFKPLINDLQDSALRVAESSGNAEAAESLMEAKAAYRVWAEAFDNDYIRPFRDNSNEDFSKLFKTSLDLDEANMIKKILSLSEDGQKLVNASTREIVEKNLSKYFNNPNEIDQADFNKTLRELEAVISPEQAQEIKQIFEQIPKNKPILAKHKKPFKSKQQEITERYEGKKPEDLMKMMNTRSGIKQIRKDFPKEAFNKFGKQKLRSILRGGNIEKDFTGDDLYKFLNKESNYEIFSEILGEKETESLRLTAKEIGKNQVKSEARKKGFKTAVNKIAIYKTIETVLHLF